MARFLAILTLLAIFGTAIVAAQIQASQLASALAKAEDNYNAILLLQTINGAQSVIRKLQSKSTIESEEMGKKYTIHREAQKILIEEYGIDPADAEKAIIEHLQAVCSEFIPRCSLTEKYRRVNGSCNNLQNPLWGSTYQPLVRLLGPKYEEGTIDDPRGGVVSRLPSPRSISLKVHKQSEEDIKSSSVTHMVAQFGQFLDHDITLTPEGGLQCCPSSNDTECWAIKVAEDDEFYSDPVHKTTCLEFTRSTPHCLSLRPREQMNIITAFIDGSAVYGSDDRLTRMLRKFSGGELAENQEIPGFLPWSYEVDPTVPPTQLPEDRTILAGDRRANEMPGLTVLHTLFLKEHNRIAREFAAVTDWDDETIFQETRRIVGAELQQITYGEYLPVVLGPDIMTSYGLTITDFKTTYNASINPTIFNSFATAAYRFGHTLVNGLIIKMIEGQPAGSYLIRNNYFIQDQIINRTTRRMDGFDQILNGLIRQEAQASDSKFTEDLTNHLFKFGNFIGSDLAARNIQRGRDHGLPGYNEFRALCGLEPVSSWDTTPDHYTSQQWSILRDAYSGSGVNDIDLYTAGLSQINLNEAQTGPTFACLMALQFQALKFGDRFFFTHMNQTGSFTDEQFDILRSRNFGDIICDNTNLKETGRNVFLQQSPMVSCSHTSRTRLNISAFATFSMSGSSPIIVGNQLLLLTGVVVKSIIMYL